MSGKMAARTFRQGEGPGDFDIPTGFLSASTEVTFHPEKLVPVAVIVIFAGADH
jgi:hypothetical protein